MEHLDKQKSNYSSKLLGKLRSGKLLYNDAEHPSHKDFKQIDHLHAAVLHGSMARQHGTENPMESSHHEEQRRKHQRLLKMYGPMSKALTLIPGGAEQKIKKPSEPNESPIKVAAEPYLPESIWQYGKPLSNEELDSPKINTAKMLSIVRKLTQKKSDYDPKDLEDDFKKKLKTMTSGDKING